MPDRLKNLNNFQLNWILTNIKEDYLLEQKYYEKITGQTVISSDYDDSQEFIDMIKRIRNVT